MSVYLDASVLIPLVISDAHTARADAFMDSNPRDVVISDFAAAEFASGLARLVRMSELDAHEAAASFSAFDNWALRTTTRVSLGGDDIKSAEIALRRLDMPLATPDTIHLIVARRLGCDLATFDVRMRVAAQRLRIVVLDI